MTLTAQDILQITAKHNFSVVLNDELSQRRPCELIGPILIIPDPERVKPTKVCYLPEWTIDVKQSGNHKTIILRPQTNPDYPVIKMKSKKIELVEKWMSLMSKAVNDMAQLKIGVVTHNVRINSDGQFVKGKILMSNHSINLLIHSKTVSEIKRGPNVHVSPAHEDPLKLNIMVSNEVRNVFRAKNEKDAAKFCIEYSSTPLDIDTMPQIFIGDTSVPDLDDSIFNIQPEFSNTLSDFSNAANDMLSAFGLDDISDLAPDENEPVPEIEADQAAQDEPANDEPPQDQPVEEEPVEKEPAKPEQIDIPDLDDDQVPDPDAKPDSEIKPAPHHLKSLKSVPQVQSFVTNVNILAAGESYQSMMEEREKKFDELPRFDPPPKTEFLLSEATLQIKEHFPKIGQVPEFEQYGPDDSEPLFKVIDGPQNAVFYSEEPAFLDFNEINLSTPFDPAESLRILKDINADSYGFQAPKHVVSLYDMFLDRLKNENIMNRPLVAAGIFLQGRNTNIAGISLGLSSSRISINEIDSIIEQTNFDDAEGCVQFFTHISEHGLMKVFFEVLENLSSFRSQFYNDDAAMRIPGFCMKVSEFFIGSSKVNGMNSINFDQFAGAVSPDIIICNNIPKIMSHLPDIMIMSNDNQNMFMMFAKLISALLVIYGIHQPGLAGQTLDYASMWRNLKLYIPLSGISSQELEPFHLADIIDGPPLAKLVGLHIHALGCSLLLKWAIILICHRKPGPDLTYMFLRTVPELALLDSTFNRENFIDRDSLITPIADQVDQLLRLKGKLVTKSTIFSKLPLPSPSAIYSSLQTAVVSPFN